MKKLLLISLFFISFIAFAQENCNNGIDDDGDGKIDLNDPDCSCGPSTSIPSIIPNPSFESYTVCPTYISQLNNSSQWQQATIPTTDYFNSCGYLNNAGMTPFPDGNAAVGTFFAKGWQEYLGACLTTPMIAGTNYQLTFNIASKPATSNVGLGNGGVIDYGPIDIVLYGRQSCTTFPLSTTGCPTNYDSSWIILGKANYTPIGNWGVLNILFTPTANINTIILGSPCQLPPNYNGVNDYAPYFYFDNLLLNTSAAFGVNVNQAGFFCDNNLVLTANLTTTFSPAVTYQWYFNGIAIVGATNSTYSVPSFATNLGQYSVKVTDGSSCFISSRITVNNTIPPPDYTTIQPNCITTTGTITITTPAIEYSFDNGVTWQSSPTKSLLPVGSYFIKIKSPNGCISSANGVIISQPQLLNGSNYVVTQPTTCNTLGSITITSASAAQYSFDDGATWSDNPTANNLTPGYYQIKIKDATGCQSASQTVYINPVYLDYPAYTTVQPTCGTNGSITITTTAFEYSFDDGTTWTTNPTATNLTPGYYIIKIRESFSCESYSKYVYINTFSLNQSPTYTKVNPTCGVDGSISITTVANEYSFDGGATWQNSPTINLPSGYYIIMFRNAVNCNSLPEYVFLDTYYLPDPIFTVIQPLCGTTGEITITTVADEYSNDGGYTWQTSPTFSNLNSGTYYVMIKSSLGCTSNYIYVNLDYVVLPDPIFIFTNPECANNGSITITSSASEFSFDGGSTWTSNPTLSNLSSGYYYIKVRNGINCESNYVFLYLQDFSYLYPEYTIDQPGCGKYASITIDTPGDLFSFDGGVTWSSNNVLANLVGGENYDIVVKKNPSCITNINTAYIYDTFLPIPTPSNYETTECDNLNDGTENIDLTNYNDNLISTSTNFTFEYYTTLSGAENQIFANQIANFASYSISNTNTTVFVRVISAAGCYKVAQLKINLINSPIIHMENNYPLCVDKYVIIHAGVGFASYLWSTGQTTEHITITQPGNYWVTVTENHTAGLICSTTKNFTIFLSNYATITSIETFDWTNDENIITANVTGIGVWEYSIDGVHFQDSNTFTNLTVGIYTIFIRDKNGCGIVGREVFLLNYPQYFTPNNDGINDFWRIKFSQKEPNLTVSILDRYGKLITTLKSNSAGWDGNYNGKQMPSDDYWFVVHRENGQEHRAHFALKR